MFIKVNVVTEKDIFREDNNLVYVKNISLKDALFGSKYDIKILNINKNIEILPGCSSTNNIIFNNEGFEYVETDINNNKIIKRGNLIIRLIVNLPDLNKLSNKDKDDLIKIFERI